jgi:PAS domain S-box-containing protein
MYLFVAILSFSIKTIHSQKDVKLWTYFGIFALLRSLSAWTYASNIYFENNSVIVIHCILFIASFICIAEYVIKYIFKKYNLGPWNGRWIFVLLLLLTSLGYIVSGTLGLLIFTDYIWSLLLGTTSMLAIGIEIYKSKNKLQRNPILLTIFFIMAICNLGHILVPKADFFPANFLNVEAFLEKTVYISVYFNRTISSGVVAVLLWFYYTGARPIRKRYRAGVPIIFFLILNLGWFITSALDTNARMMNEKLRLVKVRTLAQSALNVERINNLSASKKDMEHSDYKRLKNQLVQMRVVDPSIRFAYIMKLVGDKVVFIVDAEPQGSPDFSSPGDIWDDYPSDLLKVFGDKQEAITVGPYTDRWGNWVSAFSPITDPKTGKTVGAVGIDVSAAKWKKELFISRLGGLIVTLLIFLILAGGLAVSQIRLSYTMQLKESEEKFINAFDFSPVALSITLFKDGTFKEINQKFEALFEYSKNELIGQTSLGKGIYIDPDDRKRVMDLLSQDHHISGIELQLSTKSKKIVIVRYSAVLTELEKELCVISSLEDITDQKRYQKQIEKNEEQLRLVIEGVNDGIWFWNFIDNSIYYSPRWKEMFGYKDDELENTVQTWKKLMHPDDLPVTEDHIKKCIEGEPSFNVECRMMCKNGEYKWIMARARAKYDDKGDITRLDGANTDISESKSLMLDLVRAKEEVIRISKIKDEFLSVTSHDLKSPLGIVKTSMNLLMEESQLSENVKEYASLAMRQADKGLRLINNLLDLRKLESGVIKLEPTQFNINDLISEILLDFKMTIKLNKVKVEMDNFNQFDVVADRQRLSQVVSNLIDNALKYVPNSGIIKIELTEVNNELRVGIKNNGEKIPEEKIKEIFEKYKQTNEKDKRSGTGIGLSIVSYICQLHKSKIWAESPQNDAFTSFYFTLPKYSPSTICKYKPASSTNSQKNIHQLKTVLVVDDDPDQRLNIIKILKKNDYSALEASNWKEALDKVRSAPIDLLVLDIEMPEMNGWELLDIIRKEKDSNELPVIMFSNLDGQKEKYQEHKANDFVSKHKSHQELINKVKNLIG